ncbi:hypothetical protein DFJ73DRAFT_830295 [Zopfochytrium polystomum]|nr:hypothetical protein DFJ73DRAFT_830295 [Zopfochytrium polystomum]
MPALHPSTASSPAVAAAIAAAVAAAAASFAVTRSSTSSTSTPSASSSSSSSSSSGLSSHPPPSSSATGPSSPSQFTPPASTWLGFSLTVLAGLATTAAAGLVVSVGILLLVRSHNSKKSFARFKKRRRAVVAAIKAVDAECDAAIVPRYNALWESCSAYASAAAAAAGLQCTSTWTPDDGGLSCCPAHSLPPSPSSVQAPSLSMRKLTATSTGPEAAAPRASTPLIYPPTSANVQKVIVELDERITRLLEKLDGIRIHDMAEGLPSIRTGPETSHAAVGSRDIAERTPAVPSTVVATDTDESYDSSTSSSSSTSTSAVSSAQPSPALAALLLSDPADQNNQQAKSTSLPHQPPLLLSMAPSLSSSLTSTLSSLQRTFSPSPSTTASPQPQPQTMLPSSSPGTISTTTSTTINANPPSLLSRFHRLDVQDLDAATAKQIATAVDACRARKRAVTRRMQAYGEKVEALRAWVEAWGVGKNDTPAAAAASTASTAAEMRPRTKHPQQPQPQQRRTAPAAVSAKRDGRR